MAKKIILAAFALAIMLGSAKVSYSQQIPGPHQSSSNISVSPATGKMPGEFNTPSSHYRAFQHWQRGSWRMF